MASVVLFSFSCALYSNTLSASFTFDDNFAVVSVFGLDALWKGLIKADCWLTPIPLQINNPDVREPGRPLSHLFKNDFW